MITLVAPTAEFVYRPMAVLEPFAHRTPRRLALAEFAAELGASFVQDGVARVDVEQRTVHTASGRELAYDALVVAVGARAHNVLPAAIAMEPSDMYSVGGAIAQIESGSVDSVAFVAPAPGWPLPVYELALLARERSVQVEISILTTEPRPLEVFGENVSAAVSELLDRADIQVVAGARIEPSGADGLLVGVQELAFGRVVAVPRLSGPAIRGLPANADGFLPITQHCEVPGADRVYAVGDVTEFPVKFGSIAAQHADAAAESIAALAGAPITPEPFDGVVHGFLLGGNQQPSLYFTARIEQGHARESRTSSTPTFSPEAKIAARYLGPYLDKRWAAGQRWVVDQLRWEEILKRLERDSAG